MSNTLPESVEVGGKKAWRPSDGKIVSGRAVNNTLQERPALLGYLKRVTVHYDKTPDGAEYGKLECELDTSTGLEVFGTYLLNPSNGKPSLSSSVTFALALLECAKDELIQINVNQSKNENKYGTKSSYVNVTGIDPVTFRPIKRKVERTDEQGPKWDAGYLEDLTEKLKDHPAYKDRPARDSSAQDKPEEEFDPFADE